ncbi:cytochrome P450 [Streptomyces sp. NPDC050704]|uniref:cytochrome P450 n=1 Tax=Streptomyces sp. NPDC050704 TaxID=3157219 RepID=UPI003423CF9A
MTTTDPAQATAATDELPPYPWIGHNRECPFDPAPLLGELRGTRPVAPVKMRQFGNDAWLVTRYEDVCAVLADRRFSAERKRPNFPHVGPPRSSVPGNFIFSDPPEHTRLRRLVARNFTARTAEELRPRIQRYVDEAVDRMAAAGPPADIKTELALPLPVQVGAELVGIPRPDADLFLEVSRAIMSRGATPEETKARLGAAHRYVAQLAETKQREPGDDLMSRLVAEREATGDCTREELVGLVMVLMLGSYETTSNSISLSVLLLMSQPGVLARVREDASLVGPVVEECLRFTTVTHTGIPRIAKEDVEVGGQLIRAGEGVVVSNVAANRDEAVFEDPERFDPDRFAGAQPVQHLAFSYGVHPCIGQSLARAQMQVVLETLVRRFPGLRLAVPFEEVPFRHDMYIYGLHKLPVAW